MWRIGLLATGMLFAAAATAHAELLPAWKLTVEIDTSSWPAAVYSGPYPAAYFLQLPTNEPHTGSANVRLAAVGMSWAGITPHTPESWETPGSQGTPFDFPDLPYTLRATLSDEASGESGSLDFTGHLDVYTFTQPEISSLTNELTGPLAAEMRLGDHDYRVTLTDFVAPTGTTGTQMLGWWWNWWSENGSINAQIDVDVVDTPEPSSLALVCFAVPVGLAYWRSRRHDPGQPPTSS